MYLAHGHNRTKKLLWLFFMPSQQYENYVTTSPSRPICRAWTAPLSAV